MNKERSDKGKKCNSRYPLGTASKTLAVDSGKLGLSTPRAKENRRCYESNDTLIKISSKHRPRVIDCEYSVDDTNTNCNKNITITITVGPCGDPAVSSPALYVVKFRLLFLLTCTVAALAFFLLRVLLHCSLGALIFRAFP